jgi:hypothetical protein
MFFKQFLPLFLRRSGWMVDLLKIVLAASVAFPLGIWAWENLRDPKETFFGCLDPAIREITTSLTTDTKPDDQRLTTMLAPCRNYMDKWIARDGEETVQKETIAYLLPKIVGPAFAAAAEKMKDIGKPNPELDALRAEADAKWDASQREYRRSMRDLERAIKNAYR